MKIRLLASLVILLTFAAPSHALESSELWIYGLPEGQGTQISISTRCVNCRSLPGAGRLLSVGLNGKAREPSRLADSGVDLVIATESSLSFALRVDPRADDVFPISLRFYGEADKDFRLSYNSAADFSAWRTTNTLCEVSGCQSSENEEHNFAPIGSALGFVGLVALFFLRHRLAVETKGHVGLG
jgi:hypothetical protein